MAIEQWYLVEQLRKVKNTAILTEKRIAIGSVFCLQALLNVAPG